MKLALTCEADIYMVKDVLERPLSRWRRMQKGGAKFLSALTLSISISDYTQGCTLNKLSTENQ